MTPSGEKFHVEIEPDRQRVIVRPVGDVDLASATDVELPLFELLDRGFAHVVVDLRRVTFLDSSGIRMLVNAHKHAEQLGARVSVRLGGEASRRALEITGMLDYLDIEEGTPSEPMAPTRAASNPNDGAAGL
jgi:anti-anti-sigma factor